MATHPARTGTDTFADTLYDAIEGSGTPACVGLDPVLERLPPAVRNGARSEAGAIEAFSLGVVRAVAGVVGVVKPQSACFERYGSEGVRALERTVRAARDAGLVVVLDAKRGDIGVTADHYAHSASAMGAHAITVNGYLGPETVEHFLCAGLGVFVLVRTSNPGSDAVQSERLSDGRSVAEMMADHVAALGRSRVGVRGLSSVGAVVGATKASDGAALRARMPDQTFLVPGYGAQGGTLDDVRALVRSRSGVGGGEGQAAAELGVLVTASRSVIYPAAPQGAAWEDAVRSAASVFAEELRGLASD